MKNEISINTIASSIIIFLNFFYLQHFPVQINSREDIAWESMVTRKGSPIPENVLEAGKADILA